MISQEKSAILVFSSLEVHLIDERKRKNANTADFNEKSGNY